MVKLGPKILIVNSAEQAKLLFYAKLASGNQNLVEEGDDFGAAYGNLSTSPDTQTAEGTSSYRPVTPTTAQGVAQADLLKILGFGDFVGADIVEAIGSKGIAPVAQVQTVTFTIDTPTLGEEIVLNVKIIANNLRGEWASYSSDYTQKRTKVIVLTASDTATTVAAKLAVQLNAESETSQAIYTAVPVAGVVTITSADPEVSFAITAEGSGVDSGSASIAVAETVAPFSGRGWFRQLEGIRLQTVNDAYAETSKTDQIPVNGAKYSRYAIKKRVTRDDLAGLDGTINTVPSGVFEFVLYVNESLAGYISDLTSWLNANVAKRTMYTATTAAVAAATETPTTATSVDSSAPFSTPLV